MPNYKNDPTEDFDTIEIDELEEAIRDSRRHQKEKLKLLDKIDKANVQLQFMVDLFRGLEDKDHLANRMIEIKNTLK